MPFSQDKVEIEPTSRGLGKSDTAGLQESYPASPIYASEVTDETLVEQGNEKLLGELTTADGENLALAYWDLESDYDRDYSNAPNTEEVETGGGGLPGTPYAPNVASPDGTMNPADIPAAGARVTQESRGGGGAFQGDGLTSPSSTSTKVSRQTIGSLMFGKSSP